MKEIIMCVSETYQSNYNGEILTEKILTTISKEKDRYSRINVTYSEEIDKIEFTTNTGSVLYRNSFLPDVDIEIRKSSTMSTVCIKCSLKKSVKIIIGVWSAFLMFFVLSMTVKQLMFTWYLCLPLMFILLVILLSYISLKLSSRNVIKTITTAIE